MFIPNEAYTGAIASAIQPTLGPGESYSTEPPPPDPNWVNPHVSTGTIIPGVTPPVIPGLPWSPITDVGQPAPRSPVESQYWGAAPTPGIGSPIGSRMGGITQLLAGLRGATPPTGWKPGPMTGWNPRQANGRTRNPKGNGGIAGAIPR